MQAFIIIIYLLTSVTIPNSVDYIGDLAFAYCSIYEVIIDDNTPPKIGQSVFKACQTNLNIYIPMYTTIMYVLEGWPYANLTECDM